MIIYFSGLSRQWLEALTDLDVRVSYLQSFIELRDGTKGVQYPPIVDNYFLDSGAYSAWSMGKKISLKKFIQFIQENLPKLTTYAALDVIGDPEATLRNQDIMEDHGLDPLPTFHYGDDLKYLHMYCQQYDYIALGGLVGRGKTLIYPWLQKVFSLYPEQRFHGFGVTDINLLKAYPWYSVDSTSYLSGGKFGQIYNNDGTMSHISTIEHLSEWPELSDFIKRVGISLDEFRYGHHTPRNVFNIIQTLRFADHDFSASHNIHQRDLFEKTRITK